MTSSVGFSFNLFLEEEGGGVGGERGVEGGGGAEKQKSKVNVGGWVV